MPKFVWRIARRAATTITLELLFGAPLWTAFVSSTWAGATGLILHLKGYSPFTVVTGTMVVLASATWLAMFSVEMARRLRAHVDVTEETNKIREQIVAQCVSLADRMADYVAECGLRSPPYNQTELLLGERGQPAMYWQRARDGFRTKFEHQICGCAQRVRMLSGIDEGLLNLANAILLSSASQDMELTISFVRRLAEGIANLPPSVNES